jgi:arylsulfatase
LRISWLDIIRSARGIELGMIGMKTRKSKRPILFLFILSLFAAIFISGKFIYTRTCRPKKNVILIVVDALRPDHLGCYGYKRKTSPNIDSLVKEGAMFTQAIAQANWTFPSIPSILTSTYPHTHGVNEINDSLNSSLPGLENILKNNGYSTGLVVPAELKPLVEKFKQGFDTLEFPEGNANEFTRQAIEWIKKKQGKPFFLWIHYFDVHGPYRPPAPYNRLFVADKFNFRNKKAPIILREDKYPVLDKNSGIGGIPMYIAENNVT